MLGTHWLFIAFLLFIIGLVLHQVPLVLVSLLYLLAGGVARLWNYYCLSRVEYRRKLSASRVFFGEEVQLEVEVVNRKPLPLPWIQIEDEVPQQVTLLDSETSPSHKASRLLLNNLLTLGWYQKVKRRYSLLCQQRGYFAFGPARVRSGDLFGFFKREMELPQVDYLMVYPRIVPLEKLGISSKQPLGEILTKRHIHPDPVLTLGVRNYYFGDSLKQIHWKSTARLGKLQTKVFETTTTVDMGIFLDVRTIAPPYWGIASRLLELGIIAAASISNYALTQGYRVGLYINQRGRFTDESVRLPPSQHPEQIQRILEALAQVHPHETMSMERLIQREGRSLPWGSTLVVISAAPTDALFSTLIKMKRAGRRVALILVGGPEPPLNKHGLGLHHIRDDIIWSDLEKLSFNRR